MCFERIPFSSKQCLGSKIFLESLRIRADKNEKSYMFSLLWVVFFLYFACDSWACSLSEIFFYFLFYLYYSPTEIFLFSILTSTTPFHSEIDKLVKSEKLIGFKAVRYLVLKELHFILCLTSLRLFIKQMQKKMYLPAPKKTLRVCLRRLNWQLSELWRIISLKVFSIFFQRERW